MINAIALAETRFIQIWMVLSWSIRSTKDLIQCIN